MNSHKLAGLIIASGLIGLSTLAFAESGAQRRFNEARSLDLKLRQQQQLHQSPPACSPCQQLRDLRDQQEQRQLQLRQQQEVPPAGLTDPAATGSTAPSPRIEREQRGQELQFKMQQPIEPPAAKEAPPTQFYTPSPDFFNDR
jgi:hypothetical protein